MTVPEDIEKELEAWSCGEATPQEQVWWLLQKCAALKAERDDLKARLEEARDRINQLIGALGSTATGEVAGARRSALAFLARAGGSR